MRLYEFAGEQSTQSRLLSVLNYLRYKYRRSGDAATFNTETIINMMRNAGDQSFDYDALVAAHEASPAVQNLIKNFNQDTVDLSGNGATAEPKIKLDPEQTVDTMAKRALGRRN